VAQPARRLLVFNCHEAWISQLGSLGCDLDLVVDLPGRAVAGWDTNMRPFPARGHAVSLDEARALGGGAHVIVAHNITDLMDAASIDGPRILMIHTTLSGRVREEGAAVSPAEMRAMLAAYVRAKGVHVVAVSKLKGRDWGFTGDIVPLSVDTADYRPWTGEVAAGLRVSNAVTRRAKILLWDLHRAAFDGLPVRLVGRNPDLGVGPTTDWEHLKELLATHRFFVHTAHPDLEDGYNTATLEAMAAGLPILGNEHPSSPIKNGVNGFLSDDPAELRRHALRLLADKGLAERMGRAARETADELFSRRRFVVQFERSIERARELHAKWARLAAR
jgi:hypothetical protein